jgi:hypothetical protein
MLPSASPAEQFRAWQGGWMRFVVVGAGAVGGVVGGLAHHRREGPGHPRRAGGAERWPVAGERRGGGSSWQSLARGTGSIEVDQLNGEIVLVGRLHGVATPVNGLLQTVAHELVQRGAEPGSLTEADLLARLG